ncbi:FAD-binding oxidoreductase [Celeribacter neptunius]|uniref:FAD/FMN-containing dehydrogenase n=1 Tax=Celeribacter neptunius TaxID=588602 RepID=A0A1I3URJ9_9RHOB|nr:FAD-binding oxidoreductase [Celeribacter neptunius]SFJ85958.1 FAD/FMN-containing dehydrogenase [Celeribacter neptunius]
MTLIARLKEITPHVLTGADALPYGRDWVGKYQTAPLAVLRPGTTGEVSAILALCSETGTAVVPMGGNTGLTGATAAEGLVILSLERMNTIREIRPDARIAIVEAGVILQDLHEAAAQHDLSYPMTFGAKGSARIGGTLATNAGGSNVLRYGNTRDLCLGLEVVLADGRVLDLMSELHKDNSGYDLRDLIIGSEGTLGVITAAVLKLVPTPSAYATAMVTVPGLSGALRLLNALQTRTGGMVEAFEYMPRDYMARLKQFRSDLIPPLGHDQDHTIFLEVASTVPRDCAADESGQVPLVSHLEETLGELFEEGLVLDAALAQSEAQRALMWQIREAAAEISVATKPIVINDLCLPIDQVEAFLARAEAKLRPLDPGFGTCVVSHLGDGNVHYTIYPSTEALCDPLMQAVEDIVEEMRGSFSAEHGIGLSKLPSMRRRKDEVALTMMRGVKAAFDPKRILNPGKTLP